MNINSNGINTNLVNSLKRCTGKLASKDSKWELFRIHREVFPEIKDGSEIGMRLCQIANVSTMWALPDDKIPEIKNALWSILDARTAPAN